MTTEIVPSGTPSDCHFLIPDLSLLEQYGMMKTFLDSVVEDASIAVVRNCEAFLLTMAACP